MANGKITPVILSGGSGTRLWPLSRSERPKQLLALAHEETMLQQTARRAADPARYSPPIVVANGQHADEIEAQLAAGGVSGPATLILEPSGRNTAPAIALASLAVDPDDVLLIMPSDHVILDAAAFQAAIEVALPAVDDGWLVTFGIAAETPETGYGYIRRGVEVLPGVRRVDRFVEKPDLATAEGYVESGDYAWNGGIFLFRAARYLSALEQHAPAILMAARTAMAQAGREGGRIHPDPAAFAASPSDSIDYAVMEKDERVAVVPVAMGWSDVGSWDALHALADKDARGTATMGEVLAIDSGGCLIRTEGPLVTTVGVHDLIIVATGDAVLVMPRGSSQEVRRAVDALKREGHPALDRAVGAWRAASEGDEAA